MPSRDSVHYFGAGPAPLPTAVLSQAGEVMLNYNNLGVGICEMSHRSKDATNVLAAAKAGLSELLDIPMDEYDILFSQGGGTGQFSAVVYNMVSLWVSRKKSEIETRLRQESGSDAVDEKAVIDELRISVDNELKLDYLVTGSWSLKASQEASRLIGQKFVNVATDSRKIAGGDGKFGAIPSESDWSLSPPSKSAMVFYCDNETVDGVEFPSFPTRLIPSTDENTDSFPLTVCDMSSNFISRRVNVRNYAVIFGGAQKNIGVTGIAITIVRKSVLSGQTASPDLLRSLGLPVAPVTYDWATTAKNNSLYNTLPIFDVWVAGQVMQNLITELGSAGMAAQEEIVNQKAGMCYQTLEAYPSVYQVVPATDARSRMNICFRILGDDVPAAEKAFIKETNDLGLLGLSGHRSVGGMRISNYNAVPVLATEKLVKQLHDFAKSRSS